MHPTFDPETAQVSAGGRVSHPYAFPNTKSSSISSKLRPLVSGTKKEAKRKAKIPIAAKMKNTNPVPNASRTGNVKPTTKFPSQFEKVAVPMAVPRALKGKISPSIIHTMPPQLSEKLILKNARHAIAIQLAAPPASIPIEKNTIP